MHRERLQEWLVVAVAGGQEFLLLLRLEVPFQKFLGKFLHL